MTAYDKAVERRARAIYDLFIYDGPTGSKPGWVEHGNSLKQDEARRMARATLEADDAAGYVLVPREATEAMAVTFAHHSMAKMTIANITKRLNAAIAAGAIRKSVDALDKGNG